MKIYARHHSLKKLVEDKWIQTNELGSAAKNHFLEMRKKSGGELVAYRIGKNIPWDDAHRKNMWYGVNRNANFYTLTLEGARALKVLWPEDETIKAKLQELIIQELKTKT